MIKLVNIYTSENVWMNPDHIVNIGTTDGEMNLNGVDVTYVETVKTASGELICVTESPEEVARKVLEYRFLMIQMHDLETASRTRREIVKLAGLEADE